MSDQDTLSLSGAGGDAFNLPGLSLPPDTLTNNITSNTHSGTTTSTTSSVGPSQQRLGALESIAGELLGLSTPIFPPTTFDLPDINFSNSVNRSNNGIGNIFNDSQPQQHSLWGNRGGQLMGDLTMSSSSSTPIPTTTPSMSAHQVQQMQIQQSLEQIQQQQKSLGSMFPPAAASPNSSDDSDDLPLAQLAKRPLTWNTTSASTIAPNSRTPTPENKTGIVSNISPSHGSNTTSPSTTTPTVTSPVPAATTTTAGGGAAKRTSPVPKKAKVNKRKKKKDPNEPQKPVSAYALFFRDTQATIKGHNPNASFGEVSKIVASMWDQLDPEHKDVYKKKQETAKKQYLKQLAAYRASQVSQSAPEDTEKSPTPPSNVSVGVGVSLSPQQQSPPAGQMMMSHSPTQQQMGSPNFVPQAGVVSPPHMISQMGNQQHQQQQHMYQHNQQMMQNHHQQMQYQQQMQQQHMLTGGMMDQPQQHATLSPPQQQHLFHQQQQQYHSPPHQQHVNPSNMYGEFMEPQVDPNYVHCVRAGCTNQALENPAWDSEYCSNDCVITHCRDIFTTWVGARSGSSTFPVK